MRLKKILIIGGTHGNEITGIKVVNTLLKNPIVNVKPIMANELAVSKKVRFIETDLNRSAGKSSPKSLEEKRARQLLKEIKNSDLIIEFHNTTAKNNTCAIVTTEPNSLHKSLAHHFGYKKILVMPAKGSLSGYKSKKFISFEISNSDKKFNNIHYIVEKIKNLNNLTENVDIEIEMYKYAGLSKTKQELKAANLKLSEFKNFVKVTTKQAKLMGLHPNQVFYPIFKGEKAYDDSFAFHLVTLLDILTP